MGIKSLFGFGQVRDKPVRNMFYSLKVPCRKNAKWLLNDFKVKALRKLKDSNGNYICVWMARKRMPSSRRFWKQQKVCART